MVRPLERHLVDVASQVLLAAVAVNQVIHSVGRHLALLIEELGVIRQGQVRDVLPELPHVGRPKELSRAHLVDDDVTVAQSLHIVLSATRRGNVENKTPDRDSPFSRGSHSDSHKPNTLPSIFLVRY